jgi:hypothetical protein
VLAPGIKWAEPSAVTLNFSHACFEYEREWRSAVYQVDGPEIAGCKIDFDLDELINAV